MCITLHCIQNSQGKLKAGEIKGEEMKLLANFT